MNEFFVAALAILAFDYLLDITVDALNLGALRTELPAEFRGVYDDEKYRKSQEYLRENTRFGFVQETLGLVALLGFWFAGGFGFMDHWARGFGFGEIASGLVFIGALTCLSSLLGLPLKYLQGYKS